MMQVIENGSRATTCIPSAFKGLLERYFSIPTKFDLSQYHKFTVDSGSGAEHVRPRKLSTDLEYESFSLLHRKQSENPFSVNWDAALEDQTFLSPIPDVSKIASKIKLTREGYLQFNILKHYRVSEDVQKACFENGTRGLLQLPS